MIDMRKDLQKNQKNERNSEMKKHNGFTLIELLVVIAIIAT